MVKDLITIITSYRLELALQRTHTLTQALGDLPKLAQALLGDPFKRLFTGIEKIHESINFDEED